MIKLLKNWLGKNNLTRKIHMNFPHAMLTIRKIKALKSTFKVDRIKIVQKI